MAYKRLIKEVQKIIEEKYKDKYFTIYDGIAHVKDIYLDLGDSELSIEFDIDSFIFETRTDGYFDFSFKENNEEVENGLIYLDKYTNVEDIIEEINQCLFVEISKEDYENFENKLKEAFDIFDKIQGS